MTKIKELLFTGFFSGYVPFAPGTMGTIVAMGIYFLEYLIFGEMCRIVNLAAVVILFYPSIIICSEGEKFFGKKDPPQVVFDEFMGYWVSVLIFPFNWKIAVLAFLIFRLFDIFKPFPVNKSERFNGGFGILIDDIIAGIYTNLVVSCIYYGSKYSGLQIF